MILTGQLPAMTQGSSFEGASVVRKPAACHSGQGRGVHLREHHLPIADGTIADPANAYVGRMIQARRKAMKLTQGDLARRIGVTFQQVQKYEKGKNRVAASRLLQIAQALDFPVDYFLPREASVAPPAMSAHYDTRGILLRLVRATEEMAALQIDPEGNALREACIRWRQAATSG